MKKRLTLAEQLASRKKDCRVHAEGNVRSLESVLNKFCPKNEIDDAKSNQSTTGPTRSLDPVPDSRSLGQIVTTDAKSKM